MGRKIKIRVDNRIRVPLAGISDDAMLRLQASTEHDNPDFSKKRAMGYSTYRVPARIKTWAREGGDLTLPRGAMGRMRQILKDHGVAFRLADERCEGSPSRPLVYRGFDPRPYQRDASDACLAREQGVVRAPTGSGKTLTMLYTASRIGLNTLVILPSVKLLEQTAEVVESLLGVAGDRLGLLQGGKRRLRPITLASQQTLWSRSVDPEVREFFGAVMIDECHHAAAETHQIVIDQFPARYRLAFSADEKRRDRKEFLVYDAFGEVLDETTREECEESGAVVDVEVRIVPTDFEADWYERDPDFNRLLDAMMGDEARNRLIVEVAGEELAMGEQVILCAHRREHVRLLDRELVALGARSGCMLGGADASDVAEFAATRSGLIDGSVQAGVGTYGALGEGIDLPAVAVGVAVTPIASNKQKFGQFRGRLCRPSEGKKQGRLYVPFDRRVFDEKMLGNIFAWNRTVKVRSSRGWVDAREHKRAIMQGRRI